MAILTPILLLFLTYICAFYYKYFTRPSPLPGPLPLPFIGNVFQLIKANGNKDKFFKTMHKKYGDMWEFYMFSIRLIWLSRPDLAEKLNNSKLTRTLYFQRLPEVAGFKELEMDTHGIFLNEDYETWRFNRKFLVEALATTKFRKSIIPINHSFFIELESYWSQLNLAKPIDLVRWARCFAIDIIFKISSNRDGKFMAEYFNTLVSDELKVQLTLKDQEKLDSGFVKDLLNVVETIGFMMFPPWVRHYFPGFKQRNQYVVEHVFGLYNQVKEKFVQKRRAEIENTPIGQDLTNDLLTRLCITNTSRSDIKIEDTHGNYKPLSDYEIARVMSDVFTASSDTTINAICATVYYLCKHPHVQARLLEEIENVFGSNSFDKVEYEHLEKLKYLDAIIKEVLRMHVFVTSIVRCATTESELGGRIWPAGTMFAIDMSNVNRHPSYWTDPEEFIPERWLKTNNVNGQTEIRLFQFGGGVRECPGRFLALSELKIFISLLFINYQVSLADNEGELTTYWDSVVNKCTDLKIFIKPKKR